VTMRKYGIVLITWYRG